MKLHELRDKLWKVVRWDVQDKAWWSRCNANVLYKASQEVCVGIRTLALRCNDPEPNRDEQYYKDWLRDATNPTLGEISNWNVPDGSMTPALVEFQKAADRIKTCSSTKSDIQTDQPLVYPPDLEG